jgi:hypothetical protein
MKRKTITIEITVDGRSSIDLDGFAGQGCQKVIADFRGGDAVTLARKKPEFQQQQKAEARQQQ